MAKHELIDKYFPVLDYGFVALKDVMGTDQDIEESARVSYGKGTRKAGDTRSLLRYMMNHRHTSPFEAAELKFHMGLPIFCARQIIRHRTFSVSEYSARYSEVPLIFHTPDREQLGKQSTTNKQGRDEPLFNNEQYSAYLGSLISEREIVSENYEAMLGAGVARELARIDLPLATYTYWYWKGNLHNLFHFMGLRCDSHAQFETRVFGNLVAGIVKELFPIAFEAWLDYRFEGCSISRMEMNALREMIKSGDEPTNEFLENFDIRKREAEEFRAKLQTKDRPDFTLDHSLAKSPEYFEELIKNA